MMWSSSELMTLSLIVALVIGLIAAVAIGMISGRKRRRSDWVSLFAIVMAMTAVLITAGTFLGAWLIWRQMDYWTGQEIASGRIIRRTIQPWGESYEMDFSTRGRGWAQPVQVGRPYFQGALGPSFLIGIFSGTILGIVAVAVRRVTVKWMGERLFADHCYPCGYNLTGNTTGICPECGTPCQTANA